MMGRVWSSHDKDNFWKVWIIIMIFEVHTSFELIFHLFKWSLSLLCAHIFLFFLICKLNLQFWKGLCLCCYNENGSKKWKLNSKMFFIPISLKHKTYFLVFLKPLTFIYWLKQLSLHLKLFARAKTCFPFLDHQLSPSPTKVLIDDCLETLDLDWIGH